MLRQGFRCLSTQDPCRIMKTRPAMITEDYLCGVLCPKSEISGGVRPVPRGLVIGWTARP